MCGLVGLMSSNIFAKHKDVLADLLYLDTWRGKDSTGVAAIRQNADTHILKATVPGYEFVEGPKLENHLKFTDFLWIGHNRFGTVGKNCKTNAHPFSIDDEDGSCILVGAHNGTLKNKNVLTDNAKFGTDSEALYNEIANTSIEEAIAKVEGAWALTYYDHIEEQFRVLRNKERPLYYAWSEDKKTLFWASEAWMLRIATQRRDIKLFEDKVTMFNEDTLYCFAAPEKMNDEIVLTERKGGVVGKETPAFFQRSGTTGGATGSGSSQHQDQTPHSQRASSSQGRPAGYSPLTGSYSRSSIGLPPRNPYMQDKVWDQQSRKWVDAGTPPTTSTSQSGTAPFESGEKQQTKSGSSSTAGLSTSAPSRNKVVPIGSAKKYKGYNGVPLSIVELKNQLDNGCAWCELEMMDETDRVAWLAPGKPICSKCIDGEHIESEDYENYIITGQTTTTKH